MTKYLITGVAGFIGSNLARRLLDQGDSVIGMDRKPFTDRILDDIRDHRNFTYHAKNVNRSAYSFIPIHNLFVSIPRCDFVFHLAASADIRFSSQHPEKDLDAIIMTYDLLQWMRELNIKKIAYASSAALYGDTGSRYEPIPEDCPIPVQTSAYGASKLACEGLIQAHCAAYGAEAWIFRFCSIIGERYSHGFIYEFYKQLKEHPDHLDVVGGKYQYKTYLYVQDCINGILKVIEQPRNPNVFNLGHRCAVSLQFTIPIITEHLGLNPLIKWAGNEVGWVGDSKKSLLDINRMKRLGWEPQISISKGIEKTLAWLQANEWILDVRK